MEEKKLQTRKVGKALVVTYTGSLEIDQKNLTEEFLDEAPASSSAIVLDMKNVKKFLSSNITHLIKLYRALETRERRLYLLNVPEQVMKVLSMVNIIGKFTVLASEDELGQAFGRGGPSKEEAFSVRRTMEGKRHILAIDGSFVEGKNCGRILEEVEAALMQDADEVVLDFSGTLVMDTYSAGVLLKIHDLCQERGVKLSGKGANSVVAHVLKANEVADHFGL